MTREEMLDWLYRLRSQIYVYMPKNWLIPMNDALDMAIKALEQDPKTGHWIRWYEQKENDCVVDNIPHCKCSECGKEYDPHSSQFIKYCNECGAKMVEPQESESKRCMELAKLYLQGLRAGFAESEDEK